MIEVIITGLVGLITTISSSVVTWLLARKKYNTEVDSNVIKNMSGTNINEPEQLKLEELPDGSYDVKIKETVTDMVD